jgi:hypothetical protein
MIKDLVIIDKKQIVISYKKSFDPIVVNIIKKMIVKVNKEKHLPMITGNMEYIIYNSRSKASGGYDPNKPHKIYINIQNKDDPSTLDYKFSIMETIIHELTHAWHDRLSRALTIMRKRRKNIKIINDKKKVADNKKNIKIVLSTFFDKIYTEGFAYFCQGLFSSICTADISYLKVFKSKKKYNEYLNKAMKFKSRILLLIETIIDDSNKTFLDKFKSISALQIYYIGLHMTQTIFMVNDIDIEEIGKLRVKKFYEMYEESMIILGEKPIISYTSRKSELDYKILSRKLKKNLQLKRAA